MAEQPQTTEEAQEKRRWWHFNIYFRFYTKKDMPDNKRLLSKFLNKIGPTWRAAPLRRIVQTLCLALFCYLFFYVAWPYAEHFDEHVLADKEHIPADFF